MCTQIKIACNTHSACSADWEPAGKTGWSEDCQITHQKGNPIKCIFFYGKQVQKGQIKPLGQAKITSDKCPMEMARFGDCFILFNGVHKSR